MANKNPRSPRRPNRQARREAQKAERRARRKAGLGSSPEATHPEGSLSVATMWRPGADKGACPCAICDFMAEHGLEPNEDGLTFVPKELADEYERAAAEAGRQGTRAPFSLLDVARALFGPGWA